MKFRSAVLWVVVMATMTVPVIIAAASPYLAYRDPAYIVGGFAGIVCLSLLLLQPLLAGDYLHPIKRLRGRLWHRRIGTVIVLCALLHVAGLFVTSPADTVDALLLVAPTPFSVYGVIALVGIIATAVLVATRLRLGLRPTLWRTLHNGLALVVSVATVIHAVQIEGAMGQTSKFALAVAVLAATATTLVDVRILRPIRRRRQATRPDR